VSAKRIGKAAGFDAKGFVAPLAQAFPTSSGTTRPVYTDAQFPATMRWLRGDAEFDGVGKSVADTVNANADFLNAVKADVDKHKSVDDARHIDISARLAAIEAQLSNTPFPG